MANTVISSVPAISSYSAVLHTVVDGLPTRCLHGDFRMTANKVGYTLKWDRKVIGLALRTTKAGVRSWIFERRLHGQTVRITIGRADDWKRKAVQIKARQLATDFDNGIDPRVVAV